MTDQRVITDPDAWQEALEERIGRMFEARDRGQLSRADVAEAVADGMLVALDRLRKTDSGRAIMKDIWNHMLEHAGDTASRALGRKMLTALGGALFAAGVWFLAVGGSGK